MESKIPEVSDSDETYTIEEENPIELEDGVGPCYIAWDIDTLNRMEETYLPQWSDIAGSPGDPSPICPSGLVQLY